MNNTNELNDQLFSAIKENKIDSVRELIDKGIDVSIKKSFSEETMTPLAYCCMCATNDDSYIGLIKLLISKGADVYIKKNVPSNGY